MYNACLQRMVLGDGDLTTHYVSRTVIEKNIQGKSNVFIPEDARPVLEAWTQWRQHENLDLLMTEVTVVSSKYGFAGTVDAVARRRDRPDAGLVILDWKTSNQIYPTYAMQLAAYARAIEETVGEKVVEAWVVRLDKTKPKFQAKQVADIERAFALFQAALLLWKENRSNLFGASVSSFSVMQHAKKAKKLADANQAIIESEDVDAVDADALVADDADALVADDADAIDAAQCTVIEEVDIKVTIETTTTRE
jgi:hypothetical protein